jgi:hypothetical protein
MIRVTSGPCLVATGPTRDTGFGPTLDIATALADYVARRADNPRPKEHRHA